jgi:hypothetical protein
MHPQYMKNNCDELKSLSVSDIQVCWSLIKNSNIVTPLPEFEVAFVNALDHIGIRTKLKNPESYQLDQLEDRSLPR